MSGYVRQTIDLSSILSPEALAALQELATDEGILGDISSSADDGTAKDKAVTTSAVDLIGGLKTHFDRKKFGEKEQVFHIQYGTIEFDVKGIKQTLGQTLDSTGLTIWRAAEHLCEYIVKDPSFLEGRHVCELGGGLGVVSILVHKLSIASSVVCTDGDEVSIDLLRKNAEDTDCTEQGMIVEKLFWGEHESFLRDYPQIDMLLAADVIYEEEQIEPLLITAVAILKQATVAINKRCQEEENERNSHVAGTVVPQLILAYARRNVPIDKVYICATRLGLAFESLDGDLEPIVRFTLL